MLNQFNNHDTSTIKSFNNMFGIIIAIKIVKPDASNIQNNPKIITGCLKLFADILISFKFILVVM
jgi:hypothetical protein